MYSILISEKWDVDVEDSYKVNVLYTHFWEMWCKCSRQLPCRCTLYSFLRKIDIDVQDSYHIDVLYTHFREMWCRCRRLMKNLQFWQIAQPSLQSRCTLYSFLRNMLISEKYAHLWEMSYHVDVLYTHFSQVNSELSSTSTEGGSSSILITQK